MYNSMLGYASKLVKGNTLFSIIMFIVISQLMVINSIFSLVWKYEILLNENYAPFFRELSIYSIFIFVGIASLLFAMIVSIYLFAKNRRMFSTLRIFGATKLSIKKLFTIISLLYISISFVICIIEVTILYIRYNQFIKTIISTYDIINGIFIVFCFNIALMAIFMLGSTIINNILLRKDPYEDLRGTL